MVKNIFVKKGYSFLLINLIIDEKDIDTWMDLIDYYPLWKNIDKEDFIKEKDAFVENESWEISKLFKRIVFEDNPLVISDALKKIYSYVPKNDKEKIILENILSRLSYKVPNIKFKNKNSIMNSVAQYNYIDGEKVFNDMVMEMIDNEKECNPNLSHNKEKKLVISIKNSIPNKSILF